MPKSMTLAFSIACIKNTKKGRLLKKWKSWQITLKRATLRLLDESGVPQDSALTKRADQFLAELEWYEEALQRQRQEKETPF